MEVVFVDVCERRDSKLDGGGRLHGVSNKRSRSSISSDVSRALNWAARTRIMRQFLHDHGTSNTQTHIHMRRHLSHKDIQWLNLTSKIIIISDSSSKQHTNCPETSCNWAVWVKSLIIRMLYKKFHLLIDFCEYWMSMLDGKHNNRMEQLKDTFYVCDCEWSVC